MKTNLTLIGMPGAGKSTTGIILAKNLGLGFFDTDILIQINQQKRLQDILDSKGYLDLRKIEEQEILKINIENNVISTGGSAVYSQQAMTHLQSISKIIFLKVMLNELTLSFKVILYNIIQYICNTNIYNNCECNIPSPSKTKMF